MRPGRNGVGEERRVGVAVPAAGSGARMGGVRKPFLLLDGEPLLSRALHPFLRHPEVEAVAIALGEEDLRDPPVWLSGMDARIRLVRGGAHRGASVRAALRALPEGVNIVAVHDAARPLVTTEILERCLSAVGPSRGAVAGWPAVDTLKEVDSTGRILATPERRRFWHAQTPQVFPRPLLEEAYRRAEAAGKQNTDDSALVEWIGGEVVMVPGSPRNLKITRPEDLELGTYFLRNEEIR